MTHSSDRLNCVLRATDAAHIDEVSDCLRVSARVGEIKTCRTDTELRNTLRQGSDGVGWPAFVVIVASEPELPPALLRYPDLRVLVLTTRRKVGSLTPWLQQGASDVASLTRPAHVQHALSRLIDECVLEQKVTHLQGQLARSEKRLSQLIEQSVQAMSWWRNGELIACNSIFTHMTGLSKGASEANWFQAFDASSRAQLGKRIHALPSTSRAVATELGQTLRISCDSLEGLQEHKAEAIAGHAHEHLISVKVVLDNDAPLPVPETDSVSGLPARQTVVNKFQNWLRSGDDQARFVAMMVDLSDWAMSETQNITDIDLLTDEDASGTCSTTLAFEDAGSPFHRATRKSLNAGAARNQVLSPPAVNRTLQDLAVYRAADCLSRTLSADTLLGRLSDDRLLIVHPLGAKEAPRMLAKGIRQSLGSLGGLLDSPGAVRINTVNVSASQTASAEGLVTRLENR